MVRYFPAIVETASEGYGLFFPGVPGCTSAGATVQEAARDAVEALESHLDLTAEHGEIIPESSELDAIVVEPGVVEAERVLVRVVVPGRSLEELLCDYDTRKIKFLSHNLRDAPDAGKERP
jgi:predicted RNase H-like HicB family nuclease